MSIMANPETAVFSYEDITLIRQTLCERRQLTSWKRSKYMYMYLVKSFPNGHIKAIFKLFLNFDKRQLMCRTKQRLLFQIPR